ncbi:hypothetical protein SRABI80_03083 [Peribacillus frigoritolerans]|nr:hypothetical protein SRABI80_03083 [Peribacillus frigoritolerans]
MVSSGELFSISSLMAVVSVPSNGLTMVVPINPMTAAKAAVVRKTRTILPMIFPRRFIPLILAIAEAMLKNTKGTMIVNIRFKNKSPSGCMIEVFSPKTTPAIPPIMMAVSSIKEDR